MQKELVKGKIVNMFPPKTAKNGNKFINFMLKTDDGRSVKCQVWGDLPPDPLWKDVQFEAVWNDTYSNYGIKGAVSLVDAVDEPEPVQEEAVEAPVVSTPKKRGRPTKTVQSAPVAKTGSAVEGRETARKEAEDSVRNNLESALRVSKELKLEGDVDLVMLADLIGRTMTAVYLSNKRGG